MQKKELTSSMVLGGGAVAALGGGRRLGLDMGLGIGIRVERERPVTMSIHLGRGFVSVGAAIPVTVTTTRRGGHSSHQSNHQIPKQHNTPLLCFGYVTRPPSKKETEYEFRIAMCTKE